MTYKISRFFGLLTLFAVSSCGSQNNSIVVRANGMERGTQIVQAGCLVRLGQDQTGGVAAPIDCVFQFRVETPTLSQVAFTITSPQDAFDSRNQVLFVPNPIISPVIVSIDGDSNEAGVSGAILFTDVSNAVGGRIAGQFQLQSGLFEVDGTFNTRVEAGGF